LQSPQLAWHLAPHASASRLHLLDCWVGREEGLVDRLPVTSGGSLMSNLPASSALSITRKTYTFVLSEQQGVCEPGMHNDFVRPPQSFVRSLRLLLGESELVASCGFSSCAKGAGEPSSSFSTRSSPGEDKKHGERKGFFCHQAGIQGD